MAVRFEVEEPEQKQKRPSTETLFSDVITRIKELEGIMGPLKMQVPDKTSLKTVQDDKGSIYSGQVNKDN